MKFIFIEKNSQVWGCLTIVVSKAGLFIGSGFNFEMCKGMSTIKDATDVPDCFEIGLTIGYYNDYMEPDYDRNRFTSNYGYVFNLTENKMFMADNFGRLGRFYMLGEGVIINPPVNETS